jgi:fatty acid desaturase
MISGVSEPEERARRIRKWIRRGERRLLARHAMLGRRNAIGAALCTLSAGGMLAAAGLYYLNVIPWYLCLFLNAILASILHEIEHDLIHSLYFRARPLVANLMMLLVWVFRGNVVHGWYRRGIHLHHHRASGTETDVEERLLGLGTPWGARRLIATVDGALAYLLNTKTLEENIPGFSRRELALASAPVYPLFAIVGASFLAYHGLRYLGHAPAAWFVALYPWVDVLAVSWVAPNYLRQAALQLISSNVHYYEDVSNVTEETQVLNPVFLWPLQLFCFNFGTTHSFHHYVVDQPFYLRQLLSPWVLPALRKYGVRFNDLGTFARANRFGN